MIFQLTVILLTLVFLTHCLADVPMFVFYLCSQHLKLLVFGNLHLVNAQAFDSACPVLPVFHSCAPLSEHTVGMASVKRKNSHQSQMCIILLWTQTCLVCCSHIPFYERLCRLFCSGRHELQRLGGIISEKRMQSKYEGQSWTPLW